MFIVTLLTNQGIHGLPRIPWNKVGAKNFTGYCAHSVDTFPTWHRPYLALFEVSGSFYSRQASFLTKKYSANHI